MVQLTEEPDLYCLSPATGAVDPVERAGAGPGKVLRSGSAGGSLRLPHGREFDRWPAGPDL